MIGVLVRTETWSYDDRLSAARRARLERRFGDHTRLVDELESSNPTTPELDAILAGERLRDVGFSSRSEEELRAVRDELTTLLERVSDPAVRGRLLSGRGQAHARLQEAGWGVSAVNDLRASARMFALAGEPDEAANVLAVLGWSVQLPTEGLRAAERSLNEAIELAQRPANAASHLTQRAKLRVWLGDLEGAVEDVDVAIAQSADLDHTGHAYVAWSEVLVHAPLGDRTRVEEAHQRGEAHLAGWHDNVTGVQYDVEVADGLAHVGLVDEAWDLLARAQSRREVDPHAVRRGELVLHARIGDPELALAAWREVSRQASHEEWERARLRLMVAHAQQRLGEDPAEVAGLAFDEIARRARPDTLLRLEPEIADALLRPAASRSSVARWLQRQRDGWYLDLLDRVELRGPGGEQVHVGGRIATLLAVLLDAEAPMAPERVATLVWPDQDDEGGDPAARVRRLLHRVRGLAPVVERDADGRLRLSDDLTSDVQELRLAIGRSRAADGIAAREPWLEHAERIASGVRATQLAARTDLPPELVHDLQRQLHWVHRCVADHHVAADREDLARGHWRRALELVPDDDGVAVSLARSLVAEGRRADALEVAVSTRAALDDLGLRPSTTFEAFATTLHRADT